MKPEIKALWIKALTSGEYSQGRGYLKSAGKYCCLGVLCELAFEAGIVKDVHLLTRPGIVDEVYYDGESALLPRSVMEWAGLQGANGRYAAGPGGNGGTLVDLNDNGSTFSEIARVIEGNL